MSEFKFIVFSDVHLNHNRVKSIDTINRIKGMISSLEDLPSYDYLIITGDLFDKTTSMGTEAGQDINGFMSYLLELSYKNDFIFLVLAGTNTHDGDQSANFVTLNNERENKAKLKYISNIETWVDDNGVTWLGVPDEANPSCAQTQSEIEMLFKSKGISSVDMSLTHGTYSFHTFNGITIHDTHDCKFYQKITDIICLNGHIHTTSYRYGILTIGSTDRLRHGEEEAKGMYHGVIDTASKKVKFTFIENVEAETYLTYPITTSDTTDILREVKSFISNNIPRKGNLRLRHNGDVGVNHIIRTLQDDYSPRIEFTDVLDKNKEETDTQSGDLGLTMPKIDLVPITKTTILNLVESKLNRLGIENSRVLDKLANII